MLECQQWRRMIASLYGAFGDESDNGRDNDSQSSPVDSQSEVDD